MDLENEFFTVEEVAKIFKCHCNTIRRAIRKGFIIAIKVGEGKKSPYRISRKCLEKIHMDTLKELEKRQKKY